MHARRRLNIEQRVLPISAHMSLCSREPLISDVCHRDAIEVNVNSPFCRWESWTNEFHVSPSTHTHTHTSIFSKNINQLYCNSRSCVLSVTTESGTVSCRLIRNHDNPLVPLRALRHLSELAECCEWCLDRHRSLLLWEHWEIAGLVIIQEITCEYPVGV